MENSVFSPDAALERAIRKFPVMQACAEALDGIPYTAKDGRYIANPPICWWTNGFYPAIMWQAAAITGEKRYRDEANRVCDLLDGAFARFETLHHDVGFQFLLSSNAGYQVTGDERCLRRMTLAAKLLASRYNPNGFLRAWNGDSVGLTIIDTLMNLPLLYWASEREGDPRFRLMATHHADHAMRHHLRADGSVAHIVSVDPETGAVLGFPRGQGYESGTAWSRGQAWAIYGFAMSYRHTRNEAYLDASHKAADYFIDHLDASAIPPCDFLQPAAPDLRDESAAAIAAAGFVELYDLTGDLSALRRALTLLSALDSRADWSNATPAILNHCTTEYHKESGRHIPLIYADYFFIEALARIAHKGLNPWYDKDLL